MSHLTPRELAHKAYIGNRVGTNWVDALDAALTAYMGALKIESTLLDISTRAIRIRDKGAIVGAEASYIDQIARRAIYDLHIAARPVRTSSVTQDERDDCNGRPKQKRAGKKAVKRQ